MSEQINANMDWVSRQKRRSLLSADLKRARAAVASLEKTEDKAGLVAAQAELEKAQTALSRFDKPAVPAAAPQESEAGEGDAQGDAGTDGDQGSE